MAQRHGTAAWHSGMVQRHGTEAQKRQQRHGTEAWHSGTELHRGRSTQSAVIPRSEIAAKGEQSCTHNEVSILAKTARVRGLRLHVLDNEEVGPSGPSLKDWKVGSNACQCPTPHAAVRIFVPRGHTLPCLLVVAQHQEIGQRVQPKRMIVRPANGRHRNWQRRQMCLAVISRFRASKAPKAAD